MELSHYTEQPLVFDRERTYEQGTTSNGKPRGMWVSIDGEYGWPEWCRAENWGVERLAHRTPVTLAPNANVLVMGSLAELITFTERYGYHRWAMWSIDWTRVEQDYDGVIITPYLWDARLNEHTDWYYGWDCASGCIWNLDAIRVGTPAKAGA